ncbi:MAG: hypothetical protein AcusKO_30790 [Acuticoccus sp.]
MSAHRPDAAGTPRRRLLRAAFGASLLAVALAGCQVSEFAYDAPEFAPVPASLQGKMTRLGMSARSPILLRIYKEESELEVWKEAKNGRFELLNTYEICAWSGKLGPKKKEGDRQAPEGFYTVTPAQMNPNSSYHLSFNIGFPNQFDRSLGRTGSHLMVHGDCSSRGCYAMEDQPIQEIYALARESFRGGQQGFQVQAFPFRMTPENMAKHADDENLEFWEMLKQGSDHFEVIRQVPKVSVCNQRYVFNNAGTCSDIDVRDDVEVLVASKSDSDLEKRKTLIARNAARDQREERWAEREAAIASFFNNSSERVAETDEAIAAVSSEGAGTPAAGVPVPRRSPAAKSGVAVASGGSDNDGGFRLPNPFARFTQPVASTAGVADDTPAAPPPATATAAAPAPVQPAAPAPAPQVAATQPEPQTTVTEPLAYAPTEESNDGFFSNVAKTSRGIFKRAGSIFNN